MDELNVEKGVLAALLNRAKTLRAAFPDRTVMAVVDIGELPAAKAGRPLWQEAALLKGGGTDTVAVLDDEITHAEQVLAGR